MAEETKPAGKLGDTKKEDDEDTLSGTLANIAFGAFGPGPLGAVLGFGGAIAHAVMGTSPSHAAERSAMTGQLSNLEGLFDALEAAGLSRANPGSILGAVRPDISDPAVQKALADQKTSGEIDASQRAAAVAGLARGPGGLTKPGFPGAGTDTDATDGGAAASAAAAAEGVSGVGGMGSPSGGLSGDNAGSGNSGGSGDNDSVGREGGDSAGAAGGGGQYYDGGVFFITRDRLTGPDPKGPDTGKVSFRAKEGEAVIVLPESVAKKFTKPVLEEFLRHLKSMTAMSGVTKPRPQMPKMKRRTAMN